MADKEIVYIKLDDWNDIGDAEDWFKELESGRLDSEVNYCEVLYDMASIYCITTTRDYVNKHPELKEWICEGEYFKNCDIFRSYFPEYNPDKFGCAWRGVYKGQFPSKSLINGQTIKE